MKKINLKKVKFSANNTIVIVFAVILVILLNMLADVAETRIPALKLDLTENSITKITDTTKNLLSSLDTSVEIICLQGTRDIDDNVRDVLEQYDAESKYVSFKVENYHKNPLILSEYSISSEADCQNTVIVVNKNTGRFSIVYPTEMWIQNDRYGIELDFVLESEVTNAINYVTSGKTVTVSVLKGHDEADTTLLSAILTASNVSVIETDLTTATIPDNADMVMILAPSFDYSAAELNLIDDYSKRGGSIVVSLRADIKLERLESYLESWGVKVNEDIVEETEASMSYQGLGKYFYPKTGEHYITTDIESRIFATMSRSLSFTQTDDIDATELLFTSDNAISIPVKNGSLDRENLTTGKLSVGYMLEKPLNGSYEDTSKMIVTTVNSVWGIIGGYVSEYDSLAYSAMLEPTFGNNLFLMNSISYLADEENAFVNIPKKSSNLSLMSLDAYESGIYSAVLCIILPVIIMLLGIVVWFKRRNK